jgi:hypothetical protein
MGIVYLDGYQNAGGGSGSQIVVVANYSALPAANTVPNKFYWCSATQGTKWLPFSLGGTFYNSGLYYSNGTDWEYQETPHQATLGEVNVGVDNTKFVTPYTLKNSNFADKNFVFTQAVASTLWTINHNLGKKPSVTILDNLGREIGTAITHIDNNNLTSESNSAISGTAHLN